MFTFIGCRHEDVPFGETQLPCSPPRAQAKRPRVLFPDSLGVGGGGEGFGRQEELDTEEDQLLSSQPALVTGPALVDGMGGSGEGKVSRGRFTCCQRV